MESYTKDKSEQRIICHSLTNMHGMEVRVTNYGGRIVNIFVPDRDGNRQDVVLGFDDLDSYKKENNLTDFGATVGRYANRIGDGCFQIDGHVIELPHNNFTHCLHGGPDGWQYQVFDVIYKNNHKITMRYIDPDGHNNFPGEVNFFLSYELTERNELKIYYSASTSKPTIINLTNHSYFNLNGDADCLITNHTLQINANRFMPVTSTFIPKGEIEDVDGTVFDFRKPTVVEDVLGQVSISQIELAHGLDHNWVLSTPHAARLESPLTGICLDVYTSEPGMQVYSGNFLDGTLKGKKGVKYKKNSAICLETQKFPDSPNHPQWQHLSNAFLYPKESFNAFCYYCFSVK